MMLTEADFGKFARLGVPAELLERAHIERVTDREARDRFGITGTGDMSGIAFPYYSLDAIRLTCRIRRDSPDIENGKPNKKYVSAYGDRRHLYFVPGSVLLVEDLSVPVVLVEAEKSVLALTAWAIRAARRLLFVGLGGCWGWRGRIGKTENSKGVRVDEVGPLPDLAVCSNRDVIVMLDSNAETKPEVSAARSALVRELGQMGAKVHIASLPALCGVNGPDDFIEARGDEAIARVLELARPAEELALAEVDVAIAEIVAAKPDTSAELMRRALDAIAEVSDPLQREVLQSRLAAAVRGVIPKDLLARQVTERQQERKAREQDFSRENREADLRALPIDVRRLIKDLEAFFTERAHLPLGAGLLLAYFALNTWTFLFFDTVPYLLLESAMPGCGKSTVIRLLEAISCRSRKATSLSEAVMFRLIDAEAPTLLVDEAETIEGRSERAEALRAVAHEGYKKGGQVPRCDGENHEVRWFDVFCPKVFAAIGGLTGALLDRCLVIHLEKAPRGSVRRSTRYKALRRDAKPLVMQLEAYAVQAEEALRRLYEAEPDSGYWPGISDREAELWGPLLTHARCVGRDEEAILLAVVTGFSHEKAQIQSTTDRRISQAIELLETITKHPGTTFTPGDLVPSLSEPEEWARVFADVKGRDDDSVRVAKAAKVGSFLRRFRLQGRKNSSGHMSYEKQAAITCLSAHVPQNPPYPPDPPLQDPPAIQPAENTALKQGTEVTEAFFLNSGDPANGRPSRGQEPDGTEEFFL